MTEPVGATLIGLTLYEGVFHVGVGATTHMERSIFLDDPGQLEQESLVLVSKAHFDREEW